MDVTLTAGIIGAAGAVVGTLAGSGVSWVGESIRTKASRRYERRVRQLDEVAALADAIGGMAPFATARSKDLQGDLTSRENQQLADISFEVMVLTEKAGRYVLDPEVMTALARLDRFRDNGSVAVTRDPSIARELRNVASADAANVNLQAWFMNLKAFSDECVRVAQRCLHEDSPVTTKGRRGSSVRGWIDRVLTRTYGGGKAQADADD